MAGIAPSDVVSRLDEIPHLALYAVYIACDQPELQKIIYTYLSRWRNITPEVTGHDLKALGLPPGPIYRNILGTLRAAWLDGEITTVEQELELLKNLIAKQMKVEGKLE